MTNVELISLLPYSLIAPSLEFAQALYLYIVHYFGTIALMNNALISSSILRLIVRALVSTVCILSLI